MKTETDIASVQSSASPGPLGRPTGFRLVVGGLVLLIAGFAVAIRLFGDRSPTVDILGSYFPSWMVCIISGLTLTLVTHWIVQARNLRAYVGPGPLIYPCLMVIYTFTTWIIFYQN